MELCEHLGALAHGHDHPIAPSGKGCQECLSTGGSWVQLRLCMTCGHVGCCDSSPGRHATAHFHATGHPVIKAFEPGQDWAYCYVDEETLESVPAYDEESPPRHYEVPYL